MCFRFFLSVLLASAGLQSAYAAKVKVESSPEVDVSRYKTYSWRQHPVYQKHPELLDVYATAIELVKNTANEVLVKRGYQPAEGPPDFYITFFVAGENRRDVDVVFSGGAYGWNGWYSWGSSYWNGWTETVVSKYVRGMLVLDIVDTRTSQLVWRAYGWDDIKEWKHRDRNVAEVVAKALKKFPQQ